MAFALLLLCKFTGSIHAGGGHGSRTVAAGKDVGKTHVLSHTLTPERILRLSQPFDSTKRIEKPSRRERAYIAKHFDGMNTPSFWQRRCRLHAQGSLDL